MLPVYDGQKQDAEDSKLAKMLTMMIRFLTKHVPGRIQYENRTLTCPSSELGDVFEVNLWL